MFIKIERFSIVETIESLEEMRKRFPNISFPDENIEKINLPKGWYHSGSEVANSLLARRK